ncbi:MAG: hypothetical protein HYX68_26715 [Planctomycetes bacterium]|nr:hypothetical protein [Planctomycetota bacterium]
MDTKAAIPPEVMAELHLAAGAAVKGIRDREGMKKAAERMDHRAEKNASLYGVHDVGVDIIREMRESP